MLKLCVFKFLRQRLHVCVFLSFLFCGSDVSASMLLFVALLCHETWCVALIKLWWLCDRVSYRKPGGVQKRAPMGGQIQALPGTSVSKKFFVTYYSRRCRNVVLDPGNVTENGPAPGPYKTHASTTKNWPAKRDPNWPRWRTQFLVTRARPINHFFEKKIAQFFKKTLSFGHIQIQNQVLRWVQKMDLKRCPNSGTLLRKYIKIHQMWLKMVLLTGPIFDPKGELNSDTQASVTFSKKSYWKSNKNHSEDCNIWNFIAAVVGTDTDVRHWASISFSRQLWGPHF